jgi:hypothetical protein
MLSALITLMKKTIAVIFTWLTLAGLSQAANPQMPNIPHGVYKVTDYGAIGDGVTDNTISIQNTINAANKSPAGGGTVEFPAAAGSYLSGPITLTNSINLQVDANATLQMLPLGTYPGGVTNAQTFIYCNNVHDLEISGGGTIDGQGAAWWKYYETGSGIVRPMMLNLYSVNRLFIHDITFQNPPYHHCGLRKNGGNITISNLTVNTPDTLPSGVRSHNSDGLNFVGTNSIIENCHISDGDDNIAMGATGPINDLLITNCVFGTGHGVSIGGTITTGVSNLTVINCSFNGTVNGIRWKCSTGSSAPVQNVNYYNLTMTNVGMPIVIYSHYDVTGTPDNIAPAEVLAASSTAPVTATTPVWRDITISNLTAVNSSKIGGIIWGPTEMPISNLTLICITNTAPKTFDLYNVYGVKIIDSQFNFASGNTFTLCNAGVTLITNSVSGNGGVTLGGATSANSLALYHTSVSMSSGDLFAANPVTVSGSVLANTGDLTLAGSTEVSFALGTDPATIAVKGNLALEGVIDITQADGFGPGTYTLFTYTGSLTGKPVLGITPAGYTCTPDTSTAGQVKLVVTLKSPSQILKAVENGAIVRIITGEGCGPLIWIDAHGVIHIGGPVGPGPLSPGMNGPVKPLADLSPATRDAVIAALLSGVANEIDDKRVSKQLRALSVKFAHEGLRNLPKEGKQR